MLELIHRFRILNAPKNVVGRKAREDPWCSRPLDLPTVHKLSCDDGNNSARISLGQSHRTAAGQLSCESLQEVRLLAKDRCHL